MFRPEPFRIEPKMGPAAYKTFQIDRPADTTVRTACEEVDCAARRAGWRTVVDERTELGAAQAVYIRMRSGRTFRESKTGDGLTVFTFDSGQRCFAEHRTRPESYTVRLGDYRASRLITTHTRPADWVEDFGEHQQGLADQREKG